MTLRWREAERRLVRRVRQELSADPEAVRTARRLRRAAREHRWLKWLAWFVIALAPAIKLTPREGGPTLYLAMVTLWVTSAAIFYGQELASNLTTSDHITSLAHLPVPDGAIFDLTWQRFLTYSLVPLISLETGYVLVAVLQLGSAAAVGAATGLAILQWLVFLSLAALVATLGPLVPRKGVRRTAFFLATHLAMLVLGSVLFFTRRPPAYLVDGPARWALLAIPAGWPSAAFQEGPLRGHAWALALLLPAGLFAALLPVIHRRMRERFRIAEVASTSAPGAEALAEKLVDDLSALEAKADPLVADFPERAAWDREGLARRIPGLLESHIRGRSFLAPIPWDGGGWLVRRVERWLTRRERDVADLLLGGRPFWTARWKVSLELTTIGVATALALPRTLDAVPFGLLYLATMLGAPILGGIWPGFANSNASGMGVPRYAAVPIGYGEIMRVTLKANLVRIAAWTPLALAGGAALGARFGPGTWSGLAIAAKAAFLLLAWQPLVVSLHLSWENGAGDKLGLDRRSLAPLLTVLLLLPAVGISAGLAFAVRGPASLAWLVAFAGSTLLGTLAYRRHYHRGLDLVGPPTGPLGALPLHVIQPRKGTV